MQPVVFVHGFLDTWYMPWWRKMKENLNVAGAIPEKVYGVKKGNIPGTTVGSPDEYAELVEKKVEEVYDRHNERVNIIGHSMGGLDSRWYIEQNGGEKYVDTLVTLATPHHGTLTSRFASLTPGGKKLAMSSDVIQTLKNDGLSDEVEYVALWSPRDRAVNPSRSAKLPDDYRTNVTNIEIGSYSHLEMLWKKSVVEKFAPYLRN
jgi:triacylglycerol esterase/lipase EstA (alpha/beta hydrolase family)